MRTSFTSRLEDFELFSNKIFEFLGELNEHLLPETREQFYLRHCTIDDEDIAEWGSYMEPNPKPGSVQRKQLYSKAVRS